MTEALSLQDRELFKRFMHILIRWSFGIHPGQDTAVCGLDIETLVALGPYDINEQVQ